MASTRKTLHLIDGREEPSLSGQTFMSVFPGTGEDIAEVADGGAAEVERAVRSAHRAFAEGPWGRMSAAERARLLRRVAQLIHDRREELAQLETLDAGKPITFTRLGDVPSAAELVDWYAGAADKLHGEVYPSHQGHHSYTYREPYGVAGCISPWNYPLLMTAGKAATAMAAGNTVVLKMAEQTPLSTLEFARICLEAGIPEGVVNVVHGGPAVGEALVQHPLAPKIHFTGSTAVGKRILAEAAVHMKSVTMETGGKSANIVMADADLEQALEGTLLTAFVNSGQICTSGSRLLLHEAIADRFLEMLLPRIAALRLGDPRQPQTQLGPVISAGHRDRIMDYIRTGQEEGARLLYGGTVPALDGELSTGFFVQPALLDRVAPASRLAQEEIFGPVLSVIRFKEITDAVRIANGTTYGLACTVWTPDVRKIHFLAQAVDTGIVWVNTCHEGTPAIPFSGRRDSGLGEDGGMEGLRAFTRMKKVVINYRSAKLGWPE